MLIFHCPISFGLSSPILFHSCYSAAHLGYFHSQDPLPWVKASSIGRSQFPWKAVEPPLQLTMQCCGNANISFWVHTLTLFLAKPSAFLVRPLPKVISNITFTNRHTAEIVLGMSPMKWNNQLWKFVYLPYITKDVMNSWAFYDCLSMYVHTFMQMLILNPLEGSTYSEVQQTFGYCYPNWG